MISDGEKLILEHVVEGQRWGEDLGRWFGGVVSLDWRVCALSLGAVGWQMVSDGEGGLQMSHFYGVRGG